MVEYRQLDVENADADIAQVHEICYKDLSEPYTVAIYAYFMKNWPQLSILALEGDQVVGVIVGGIRTHQQRKQRGYIAMLAVKSEHRHKGIAKNLVSQQIEQFKLLGADEIVLETECSNTASVHLYEKMGFLRTKRMFRFYFGMNDAFRLVMPLTDRPLKPTIFLNAVPEIETKY